MKTTFKKLMLILKLIFLSVFGTSRGLANVEREIAFITGEDLAGDSDQKRNETPTS